MIKYSLEILKSIFIFVAQTIGFTSRVGRSYTQNPSKNLGKKRWKIGRQGQNVSRRNVAFF